jgi:cytochrome b561
MRHASKPRYDAVSMLIHWLAAGLMIFMMLLGEELMEMGDEAEELGSTFGPTLHVSIGASILILTLFRILWRMGHRAPPLNEGMKAYEVWGAKAIHGLFYLLMIGLPLTGWLAFGEFVQEEPAMAVVRIFGAFSIPSPPLWGEAAADIHEIGSKIAIALTALHVLAALKHQFINRDGTLWRMLPR